MTMTKYGVSEEDLEKSAAERDLCPRGCGMVDSPSHTCTGKVEAQKEASDTQRVTAG